MIILTVLFLASQIPGALLEIGGGSGGYFVQPALLATLLFTLAADAYLPGNSTISLAY